MPVTQGDWWVGEIQEALMETDTGKGIGMPESINSNAVLYTFFHGREESRYLPLVYEVCGVVQRKHL